MLQISRRADYALRVLLALAEQTEKDWLSAGYIAKAMLVPRPFLHKITADLVQAGLVKTRFGRRGGLALARPAAEINLRQVLDAMDGPICLNVCLLRPDECPRDKICPAHNAFERLQLMLLREMEATTLDKLAEEGRYLVERKDGPLIQVD